MAWNEDTIEELKLLWSQGHSTQEIGRRMGMSKNSIVGKAHRLNLLGRESPIIRIADGAPRAKPSQPRNPPRVTLPKLRSELPQTLGPPPRPEREAPPEPPVAVSATPVIEPAIPAPFAVPPPEPDIRPASEEDCAAPDTIRMPEGKTCCWPIGSPGTKTFRFCQNYIETRGSPYCQEHREVAYTGVGRRQIIEDDTAQPEP